MRQPSPMVIGAGRPNCRSAGCRRALPLPDGAHGQGTGDARVIDLRTEEKAIEPRRANDLLGVAWLQSFAGPSNRSVARANPVSISVVAAAATIIGPCRSCSDSSRADRRRTDTVTPITIAAIAVASSAHCDSAAPSSSNCDRTTAVSSSCHCAASVAASMKATTAPVAATSATAGIRTVRDQTGGEQNECCKSSKNIAEHDKNLPTNSASKEVGAPVTRKVDVDQRNSCALVGSHGRAFTMNRIVRRTASMPTQSDDARSP